MKLIHPVLLLTIVIFISCKKEPNEVSPTPEVVESPFYYYTDFRVDPKAIYNDNDGNCRVIANGYVYKLNSNGVVMDAITLSPGSWARNYAFTKEGHFYSSLRTTTHPHKEVLAFYHTKSSSDFYHAPQIVDIKQTKLQNANDEVWYWFGHNYTNNLSNFNSAFRTLQTATKFVKNANTGKVDTLSVLLNIEYPFGLTDSYEIILPHFKRKAINYDVYATDKYVLVNEDYMNFYRYDNKLNFIDSFTDWPNPLLYAVNNQFLCVDRGDYYLSPDGTTKGAKINQLEGKDRIFNIDGSIIYGLSNSNDIFSLDLKSNVRTTIIKKNDKRFNNLNYGIYKVWKNRKGKHFLFTSNGLFVF